MTLDKKTKEIAKLMYSNIYVLERFKFPLTVNDDELKRIPNEWILTDFSDNIFIYE